MAQDVPSLLATYGETQSQAEATDLSQPSQDRRIISLCRRTRGLTSRALGICLTVCARVARIDIELRGRALRYANTTSGLARRAGFALPTACRIALTYGTGQAILECRAAERERIVEVASIAETPCVLSAQAAHVAVRAIQARVACLTVVLGGGARRLRYAGLARGLARRASCTVVGSWGGIDRALATRRAYLEAGHLDLRGAGVTNAVRILSAGC